MSAGDRQPWFEWRSGRLGVRPLVRLRDSSLMDAAAVDLGLPLSILMEGAGQEMGLEIASRYDSGLFAVEVFCGPGNNGGDGFVVARVLLRRNFSVRVHVFAGEGRVRSNDLLCGKLRLLELVGARPVFHDPRLLKPGDVAGLLSGLRRPEKRILLVDALFGVGLGRALESPYKDVVVGINEARLEDSSVEVLSLDLPSGLNLLGEAEQAPIVRADRTLSLEGVKDLFLHPKALPYLGRVSVLSIDFPKPVKERFVSTMGYLPDEVGVASVSVGSPYAHKRSYGRSVVVAGSRAYPGSVLLAVKGALGVGSPYLEAMGPSGCGFPPQVVPKPNFRLGFFSPEDLGASLESMLSASHFLIGPGLGLGAATTEAMGELLRALPKGKNLVVDADGIAHLRRLIEAKTFSSRHGHNILLTPHFGEFARFVEGRGPSLSPRTILEVLRRVAEDFELHVLVKDCLSLLQSPGGGLACVGEPNALLAKAGSGDIFAGMVLGLLPTSESIEEAARSASLLLMERSRWAVGRFGERAPVEVLYALEADGQNPAGSIPLRPLPRTPL